MANKENLPPRLATPPVSKISPSNKPALGRQRDHSACRADTPLKVKKTRENLKQASAYGEIPPPCNGPYMHHEHQLCNDPGGVSTPSQANDGLFQHSINDTTVAQTQSGKQSESSLSVQSKVQRQKSVSRRMLSRVKQGITSRSRSSQAIRPAGSETSLARRLSGRRKPSSDAGSRSQSFELSRDSIESSIDEDSGVGASTPPPVQRSFTDSTVSTSEILEDLASVQVPSFQTSYLGASLETGLPAIRDFSSPPPSSPSPQPTPRPLSKYVAPIPEGSESSILLTVPCVDLRVTIDSISVDVNSKRDVWIAIVATIRLKTTKVTGQPFHTGPENSHSAHTEDLPPAVATSVPHIRHHRKHSCGLITNLRLCYKPAEGCRVRNIIGQKSYKDLKVGQQCTLFIKVGVPKLQTANADNDPDQESLFAELESMVGTLETDILHVEARYRHSVLPSDNVVALKYTCKVLRPKTDSRWSIIGLYEKEDTSSDVHAGLAHYLAEHYAADEALELLHRYFDFASRSQPGMAEVCSMLQTKINSQRNALDDRQPEVVVTDIDMQADAMFAPVDEHFDTAPSTPVESQTPKRPPTNHKRIGSSSSLMSSKLAPPIISAPKTTTALTTSALASSSPQGSEPADSQDSARQLWRHIRRTSLSARQLEEMTPDRLSRLEAGDDSLKELRRRAIANKRSIGAETLRTWKWEEDMQTKERPAEAPWM